MSITEIIAKAGSMRVIAALAAALVVVSCLAGWSLWRLAGSHSRCDLRIAQAQARGSAAVQALVAGQEASLALLKADDDTALLTLSTAIPGRQVERITVYRERTRAAPTPECRATAEQVQAINEALR